MASRESYMVSVCEGMVRWSVMVREVGHMARESHMVRVCEGMVRDGQMLTKLNGHIVKGGQRWSHGLEIVRDGHMVIWSRFVIWSGMVTGV